MFESSLVESTPLLQSRNRWPTLISLTTQVAVVAALILIPILHPEVVPVTLMPQLSVIAPRFHPEPPPVIVQPVRALETATASPASQTEAPQPSMRAFNSDGQTVDVPALAVGMNLGETGPNPAAFLGAGTAAVHVSVATEGAGTARAAGPINVSRGVTAGLLLAPIQPEYPPIAKITRTEGTVVVQAIISTTGHIESAHVLSGPQVLQAAALQAVRNARYRPYLLNDRPTEVETTISIVFQLHG